MLTFVINGTKCRLFNPFLLDLHQLVYKHFLKSYLQKLIAYAEHLSYKVEYSILSKANQSLTTEIAQIKTAIHPVIDSQPLSAQPNKLNEKTVKNEDFMVNRDKSNYATKNSCVMKNVEVQTKEIYKKDTISVGVQACKEDNKSVTTNISSVPNSIAIPVVNDFDNTDFVNVLQPIKYSSPKRVVTTTLENQEKIVTEIETEDILDKPLPMKNTKSIFSNFGSTLNRIEGLVKTDRQTKLDSLNTRLGFNWNSSDSGSHRQSSLGFRESSETTKNFYPTSSKSYTESFNLYIKSRKYSSDNIRDNYREQTNNTDLRKLVSIEMESKALQNNCKALEIEIEQVRKDNQEYLKLLQDLSHINVFTNHLSDVKKQIQEKCIRKPQATQTDDLFEKKEPNKITQSPKITAHIKPLQSTNRPFSPGSFINLSYDMSENDVVTNISTVFEISDPTSLHKNQNGKARRAWDANSPGRDNISPIPTNEIEFKQATPAYLQNVFSRLRNKSNEEVKSSRSRPITWYGTNHSDAFLSAKDGEFQSNDTKILKESYSILEEDNLKLHSNNRWFDNRRNTNV